MNKTLLLLPLLLLVFEACTAGSATEDELNETRDPLAAFTDFPDSLFNGLYWQQPLPGSRLDLEKCGFSLLDSSGAFNYYNSADSTAVILPDQQRLGSLKLVLRSRTYLDNRERLLNGFSLAATEEQTTPEFCIFKYDLSRLDFKLTVFTQPGFIRLNFELEISR